MSDARAAGGLFFDEHLGGEAMADVVERLRKVAAIIEDMDEGWRFADWGELVEEAAAEIERLRPYVDAFRREEARADRLAADNDGLRAERDRLREALREIEAGPPVDFVCRGDWERGCYWLSDIARAALGEDAT